MSQPVTRIDPIGESLYRISTALPPDVMPGGFTFNQFLLVDQLPLLVHTGLRSLFPAVRDAITSVMPLDKLRYVSFCHYESDECATLNEFLEIPKCRQVRATF